MCWSSDWLADVFVPVFEGLFYLGHELACVGPVDDAVIEAEGEVQEVPDGDGVGSVFGGDDGGFLEEAADAEDGRLGLVDDGRTELLAEDAGVGDGEGPGADFVGLELFAARSLGKVGDGAGDAEEVFLFGFLDDGNDESPVERNGDANVDVRGVADGVACHLRVDDGHFAQVGDDGAGDEGHIGELDAVALLVLALLFRAEVDDFGEVHLEDGVDVRVGVLGVDHALRDDGAHF